MVDERGDIEIKYAMVEEWWKMKYEVTNGLSSQRERHNLGL
jgi:hypothetical protein